MKLLVTGSEGYLGVPLTQVLEKEGHEVVGLDTGYYREAWLGNGAKRLPNVITKDIREVAEADLKGFDAVVHLAELSNDPLGQIDRNLTIEINHKGTVHLATCAKKAGVPRFVYFSSCSVYGASDELLTEESPVNPLTAYAECKVRNEKALLKLADESFTPTILRNATAYGPSPRMRFDLAINNLAASAYTTNEVKMTSDGMPWRPFTHVLDISDAVVNVLAAPQDRVHAQVLNVGSGNSNYRIKGIARIVADIFPESKITLNPKNADKRNYRVSFEKISKVLPEYRATRDVRQGVLELKELFERTKLSKAEFTSKDYTRLRQIEYLRKTGRIDTHFYMKSS